MFPCSRMDFNFQKQEMSSPSLPLLVLLSGGAARQAGIERECESFLKILFI